MAPSKDAAIVNFLPAVYVARGKDAATANFTCSPFLPFTASRVDLVSYKEKRPCEKMKRRKGENVYCQMCCPYIDVSGKTSGGAAAILNFIFL